jgi:hypothetical protein
MLKVNMLGVTYSYCFNQCHYAECCYAEYHGAMCLFGLIPTLPKRAFKFF